jgi:hypothetical protein
LLKTCIRIALRTLSAAGIVVAILAAFLLLTPRGALLLIDFLWERASGDSGLVLSIETAQGGVARGLALSGVVLSIPGEQPVASADGVAVRLRPFSPGERRLGLSGARLEGATVLLERRADGTLAGWSALGRKDEAGREDGAPAWTVMFDLDVIDLDLAFRDTASGVDVSLSGVDGSIRGEAADLDASLAGAVSYVLPGGSGPIDGTFDGNASLFDGTLELRPLRLDTNAGTAEVEGHLVFAGATAGSGGTTGASADLGFRSSHDLSSLAAVLAADALGVSGSLDTSGRIAGPLRDPEYSADLSGYDIAFGGTTFERARAKVSGRAGRHEATALEASGPDGAISGSAAWSQSGGGSAGQGPVVEGSVVEADISFLGVALERVLERAPSGAEVSAELSGSLKARVPTSAPWASSASLACSSPMLSVGGSEIGALELDSRVSDGRIALAGTCCGAAVEGSAVLTREGMRDILATAEVSDLQLLGTALGAEGLAGRATVRASADGIGPSSPVSLELSSDDIRYSDIQVAPAEVTATLSDGNRAFRFSLFGASAEGEGRVDPDRRYEAAIEARDFDLASVVPDSLERRMGFSGRLGAAASVSGSLGGDYRIAAEIGELTAAARGETLFLDSPVHLWASPDSMWLSDASIRGAGGGLRLSGGVAPSRDLEFDVSLEDILLASALRFLPTPPSVLPGGSVSGAARVRGSLAAPELEMTVELSEPTYRGVTLRSASLSASADSSDVFFQLSAASATSGTLAVTGALPVVPDSAVVLALDPSRELGVSLVCSGFALTVGDEILPAVRGGKRFGVDGSMLIVGTPDSLSSLNGSGFFTNLSAEFDLARFALADTAYFEVDRGRVGFEGLAVHMSRKRVLGDPEGGTVFASGIIDLAGDVDLELHTSDLDVGHLARAVGPRRSIEMRGRLNAEATVRGRARAPRTEFSLDVDSPVIADFGFERLVGRGVFEERVLTLDGVELSAGRGAIAVSGEVAVGAGPGGASVYDLAVVSEGLDLSKLGNLPPHLSRLDGDLRCAMRVSGVADSASFDGQVKIEDGSVEALAVGQQLRGIDVDIEGDGSGLVVRGVRARLGGGEVTGSGLIDFSLPGDRPLFFLSTRFRSPEVKIVDLAEGKLNGGLTWGGSPARSVLRGRLSVEDMRVTRSVGLSDLVARPSSVIFVRRGDDPRERVDLDLEITAEDGIEIDSNVARLTLEGGAAVKGTLARPRVSGSFVTTGGTFTYLDNDFVIERLDVSFVDPRRRDPRIDLLGTAEVESRSGDIYQVTARFEGFAREAVPVLTSTPVLSEPDIVALLTFGTTFGGLVAGEGAGDSSGDSFGTLATGAFLSSAFGLAENSLERLLHLDKIAFEEEALTTGNIADAGVTLGKDFGGRLRVSYTTSVGRFSNQRIEVAFELARRLWLESRTDPEGNHAVGVKLQIPFR